MRLETVLRQAHTQLEVWVRSRQDLKSMPATTTQQGRQIERNAAQVPASPVMSSPPPATSNAPESTDPDASSPRKADTEPQDEEMVDAARDRTEDQVHHHRTSSFYG